MLDHFLISLSSNKVLIYALTLAIAIQTIAWLFQWRNKNADYVDIAWSFGIAVLAVFYLLIEDSWTVTALVLLFAPVLWYLRLGSHLIRRFDINKEDGRYRYLRRHWSGSNENSQVQLKFYVFFIFQAILIWFFSFPVYLILEHGAAGNVLIGFAVLVITVSFLGVVISDNQLHQFKQKQSGEVCNIGLWKYSRHPNYFFEWLHWCSYPILGWHAGALENIYWWLLLSYPFWMFIFLWKITGIPFNEQQNLRSKGEKYRIYQKTTNAFFPGKPKEIEESL